MIALLTGIAQSQIEREMTLAQLQYAGGVIFSQNFDLKHYPEAVQGKVEGLLALLGIGRPKPAEKFSDEVLDLLLDPQLTDRAELTKAIFRSGSKWTPTAKWSRPFAPSSASRLPTFEELTEKSASPEASPAAPTSPRTPTAPSPAASGA